MQVNKVKESLSQRKKQKLMKVQIFKRKKIKKVISTMVRAISDILFY